MEYLILYPEDPSDRRDRSRIERALGASREALSSYGGGSEIRTGGELSERLEMRGGLKHRRLLFVISLDETGMNPVMYEFMHLLRKHPGCLEGSAAAVLTEGPGELYTKAASREAAFTLNACGAWLIGRPLCEATGSLKNQVNAAAAMGCTPEEAFVRGAADLSERLSRFDPPLTAHPKILCLHTCNPATSNTFCLWQKIRKRLEPSCEVREISLRGGSVHDCAGCSFATCMYFSKNESCYYGGPVVDEVYPALSWCDALILLCPNYNDAIGAGLTATINRLTSLFRRRPFFDKQLYAVVVSGYSGGDLVARQLIGSLGMNKSFMVPPGFVLYLTAGEPREAASIPGIGEMADAFASNLLERLNHKSC